MKINVTNQNGEFVASRTCTTAPLIEGGNLIGVELRCQPISLPDLKEYNVAVEISDEGSAFESLLRWILTETDAGYWTHFPEIEEARRLLNIKGLPHDSCN